MAAFLLLLSTFTKMNNPQWANPDMGTSNNSMNNNMNNNMNTQQMENEFFAPLSTLDEPVRETIMRDVHAVATKLKVVLLPMDRTVRSSYYCIVTLLHGYIVAWLQDHSLTLTLLPVVMTPWTTIATIATTTTTVSMPILVQQLPYGGYAGVSQSENVELTDRDKAIIQQLKDWDLWGPLIVCLALGVLLSFKAPVGQASLVFAAVFCAVWLGSAVVTINAQLLGGTISFFQSVCVLGYCVCPMTLAAVVVDLFKMIDLGFFSTLIDLAVLAVAFLWSTRASAVFIGQYVAASRRVLAVFPVLFFYTFLAWLILLF
eukprot:Nitzschia sp. Nitz4//scaffold23_size168460//91088//92117//NITZ4_002223-RA/size168460-augustus-gene-0.308-mRNA-1//-1//CDS//3329543647//6507//frame0